MRQGFIYSFPADLWDKFYVFTNKYTVFTVTQREPKLVIDNTVLIQLETTVAPERAQSFCDEYIGSSIIRMAKGRTMPSKVQRLLDETKTLLDLQKEIIPDPAAIEIQTRKLQEAYTDYMQQPNELK